MALLSRTLEPNPVIEPSETMGQQGQESIGERPTRCDGLMHAYKDSLDSMWLLLEIKICGVVTKTAVKLSGRKRLDRGVIRSGARNGTTMSNTALLLDLRVLSC